MPAEVDEDGDPVVYMFVSQPPDEIMCPICMDVMKDAVITPYGHSYCKSCVERYIQTSGLCPLTRKPLTEANLTPNLLARTIVDELEVYCPNGIKFGERGVSASTSPREPSPRISANICSSRAQATAECGKRIPTDARRRSSLACARHTSRAASTPTWSALRGEQSAVPWRE